MRASILRPWRIDDVRTTQPRVLAFLSLLFAAKLLLSDASEMASRVGGQSQEFGSPQQA
jgi:hypothetical protein